MNFSLGAALRVAAYVCLGLVSACGGGGGGGDEGGDGSFSVSYDRSSVSFNFAAGQSVAPAVVQATGRGTPTGPLFVGATTPSGQPDPNIDRVEVALQGQGATVNVFANAALGAGTYRGTIVLLVCTDNFCNRHVTGSPFNLSYTITVTPGIELQPTPLVLEGDIGTPVSATVTVSLPPGASGFVATPLSPRLTVDQVGATSFRLTANSATPGVFADDVQVRSGALVKTLQVQYTARNLTLKLDKTSLAFSVVSGETPSATLAVTQLPLGASGIGVSNDNTPWLDVSSTGSSTITARVLAMPSGSYTGSLSVTSNGAIVTVPVSYTVSPPNGGDRALATTLSRLDFTGPQGTTMPSQVLGLVRPSWNDAVDVSIQYTGTSGWLQFTTLPNGDLQFTASAIGQPVGTREATVTLTGAYPSPTLTIPVRFVVTSGLVRPFPQFVIVTPTTPATVTGSFLVTAEGASPLTWSATACDTWLRLTRSTGVLGTALEYTVDVTQLRAMPVGADQSCVINLSVLNPTLPPGGVGIFGVQAVVSATFDPPRTAGAAPPQVRLVPAVSQPVEFDPAAFAPAGRR